VEKKNFRSTYILKVSLGLILKSPVARFVVGRKMEAQQE
jgi:hypothetical protein